MSLFGYLSQSQIVCVLVTATLLMMPFVVVVRSLFSREPVMGGGGAIYKAVGTYARLTA